jgi:hypothetical protein
MLRKPELSVEIMKMIDKELIMVQNRCVDLITTRMLILLYGKKPQ